MNRAVPSVHNPNVAASDEKPRPSDVPSMKPSPWRRSSSASALAGLALAASGLTGIGGTLGLAGLGASALALAAGDWAAASALVTGPGFAPLRAAARMLAVSLGPLAASAGSLAF